nr:PREDICTED: 2,3-bisphosphoglycerate-dependent phosphoglycerate mutase-like isoform X2 [Daucus carota subsp. sativus]
MAAAFHQAICGNQLHGYNDSLSSCDELRNFAMMPRFSCFGTSKIPLNKAKCMYNHSKVFVVRASVSDSIVSSLDSSDHDSWKMTDESALILLRHGESMWNEKNLFTGCVDVPLTNKGVEEAIEAGKRIRNIPIDLIYTSALVRSQMTAMLALTQHCCEKVPIFMHNETEQATLWSQIYSEDTKRQSIPVIKAWQLNERMYGDLQGLNKQQTAERFGKEQVYKWRRSYYVRPPNGESLEMCLERAVSYFKEQIEPQLLAGRHLMVVAHANSLRSIIMYLDKLTPQELIVFKGN